MDFCVYLNYLPALQEYFSGNNFIKPDKEWIQPADVNTCGSSKGPEPLNTT